MGLEEYRRKRNFARTPEPQPPATARTRPKGDQAGHSYLIQKHAATRLHYDLRLELDGVLLSWAVTKGPSLNPKDKRLAVRTEDHPLSYGSFEGTIPKGEYGGGTVMLWDQGSWEPHGDPHAGLKKGHLAFDLKGKRLHGAWDLVRMHGDGKRENWLLIKHADAAAKAQSEIKGERSVETGRTMDQIAEAAGSTKLKELIARHSAVQLATLGEQPPEGDEWLHEIKFDGYRLLGYLAAGKVCLFTRNGNDWTQRFPAIVAAMKRLPVENAVLDMEAVVLDAEGRSTFQALQAALGTRGDRKKIVGCVFDLLELAGRDMASLPLIERKQSLQALLGRQSDPALRYSDHVVGRGSEMFSAVCKRGLEGMISKAANAPYRAGRQSGWIKVKCGQRQEFVIVGYSRARSGERALGALYLAYQKDGELRYAGKVGTGFSMQSARELTARFATLTTDKPVLTREQTPGMGAGEWRQVRWVKPVLLGEVAFTEWTADGRIRHPSFQGLREDKSAARVVRETPKRETPMINITHRDRVISETGNVTKGDLADYYAAAAPRIIASIARHPLSLLRCPTGISGECFFQRSPGKGFSDHIRPYKFKHKGKVYDYFYIDDEIGLLELIQMGTIEIHPWGATVDSIDCPDRMIFDLDPAPDVPVSSLKRAALDLRQRLRKRNLESELKCTGGKGLHLTVPLAAHDRWPEVKAFAASIAGEMVASAPEAYIATMSKAKRRGKIFIDFFRNDYTATAIADYSVRARAGAPVAMPIEWSELKHLESPSQFTIKDALKRLKRKAPASVAPGQDLAA